MADLFDSYAEECRALARSLVIKFDLQNTLVNKRLLELGYEITTDPSGWKYNLNLAGEYHERDELMYVVSNDTQATIPFTKESLANHPRTKSDFLNRTDNYYRALEDKYPLQRLLIKSICRNITIHQVVNARDFQILDWDRTLVAKNEVSLIKDLQTWIDDFVEANWNQNAVISDPGYPAAFYAVMAQHIPVVIENLRKAKSHTVEASQFHIWTYLAGFYALDRYRNVLSHEQAIWLYYNIRNVRRYLGRTDKMKELIDVLLTKSGLKLNRLYYRQNEDAIDTQLFKHSFFYKHDILDETDNAEELTFEVMRKTKELGLDNERDLKDDVDMLIHRGKYSSINDRIVGLVEAEQTVTDGSQTVEVYRKRWDYAIYLAHLGIYEPDITIPLPNGAERTLKLKDAIILYFFAQQEILGGDRIAVPTITIDWLAPTGYPSFSSLRRLLTDNVSDEMINSFLDKKLDLKVDNALDFENLIQRVINLHQWQEVTWESQNGHMRRAETEQLANAMWKTVTCQLAAPGTIYNDWLKTVQINKYDFGKSDWTTIADNVLMAVTGEELESGGLPIRQQSMLDIFDSLTSYTLRYIVGDTTGKVQNFEIPNIHWEVERFIVIEDHYIPVGRVHDTDEMATELTYDVFIELPDRHHYLEEHTAEYLVETGSELYIDENTGETHEVTVLNLESFEEIID
ncbi:virion structural protein [Vibrio phage vB_pir03]|nr:virion structural protein [Vibrio phage vB_pir03]